MSKVYGRYTRAVVCRIPKSFVNAIGATELIKLEEARREHLSYTRILRELGLDVLELPADENFPDCPFVEDTAIICNEVALISKPGHPSREKEVRRYLL